MDYLYMDLILFNRVTYLYRVF